MPAKDAAKDEKQRKIITAIFFIIGLAALFILYAIAMEKLPLTTDEGETLIEIAGKTLTGQEFNNVVPQKLTRKQPVFVSIYQNKTRVACVGYSRSLFPLYESVELLAKGIELEPIDSYEIMVTVLGEYAPLNENEKIPAQHGVLVRRDGVEGVVLPLTFTEQNLTDTEALNLAAKKAGFTDFTWEGFEVFTFNAQIFQSKQG